MCTEYFLKEVQDACFKVYISMKEWLGAERKNE